MAIPNVIAMLNSRAMLAIPAEMYIVSQNRMRVAKGRGMPTNCESATSDAVASPEVQSQTTPGTCENTYGQILKSSALIGSSSLLNIAIGIIRTKVLALLLGPGGFGLFGIYGSISNLSQCVAGMGINSSGVRQIAYAVGTQDKERIAQTASVLRRISVLLGILGVVLLVEFSGQVSTLTFGSAQHAGAISLLSMAVLFQTIASGQGALIQGMRRIVDLAKISVLGAAFGTLIAIPVIYFMGEKGVVPSLVGLALMSLVVSFWYSRKIRIGVARIPFSVLWRESSSLLKLGFAFMASGVMTLGMAYAVRIMVLRNISVEATGLYQSAWTLGGLYVGVILQAMGADFFPRLTANADDNAACNRLVNEQTQVGLLLAGPGVMATLTLAPVVLALFYSAKFHGAVGVLRWLCCGTLLQVITWPMSYIIVAKGKQVLLLVTELAWGGVSLCLSCAGAASPRRERRAYRSPPAASVMVGVRRLAVWLVVVVLGPADYDT